MKEQDRLDAFKSVNECTDMILITTNGDSYSAIINGDSYSLLRCFLKDNPDSLEGVERVLKDIKQQL